MNNKVKSKHRIRKASISTILCFAGMIAALGADFVLAEKLAEKQEGKAKKPRFELSEKTLVDNTTRLMWPLNGHLDGQTVSWNGAFDYIESMNREVYCGFKNWRLPSREELETLVEHVKGQGFGSDRGGSVAAGLHALGMKNIKEDEYWSSTEHIYNSGEAWFVNMKNGSVGTGMKTLYYPLLPVRSLP